MMEPDLKRGMVDVPEDIGARLHGLLTSKQQPGLEEAAQMVLASREALDKVLAGIVAKDDVYRYNCFQVLYQLSEAQPEALYPEWDHFAGLLDSSNAYHRSIGAQLIANLAQADAENRLEGFFDRYFSLLDDDKIVTARQFAQHVGKIVQAKPHLQAQITERLMAVDETHHSESRKDLLKADVIAALEDCFAGSPDQQRILDFVEQQLTCSSPTTRKAAQAFLKRHPRP